MAIDTPKMSVRELKEIRSELAGYRDTGIKKMKARYDRILSFLDQRIAKAKSREAK